MDEFFQQMRGFIMTTENLIQSDDEVEEASLMEAENLTAPVSIREDLEEVIYKLRAFTESSDGDYAWGVEIGMQRAAEMIENVIRRHFSEE